MTARELRVALIAAVAGVLLVLAAFLVWRFVVSARTDTVQVEAADTTSTPADDRELELLRAAVEAERVAAAGTDALRQVSLAGEFSHAEHRDVDCLQCHSTSESHGALKVASAEQCRSCHHRPPVATSCARCHGEAEFHAERRRVRQTFTLSVGAPVTREIVFAHVQHRGVQCTSCHGAGVSMAVTATCNDCHKQHHRAQAQCMSCHTAPPRASHTVAAHLGCAGAGCHNPTPVNGVPRVRNFCLVCHQEKVNHERGGNCEDCHMLPPPRGSAS